MDTEVLVDRDIQDGQRLLDALASEGIPVRVACWIKRTDDANPSLFIVTPIVEQKGPIQAYRDVLAVLALLKDAALTASNIGLLSEKHPILRDVQNLGTRDWQGPIRPRVSTFGGMAVDEVYVYPSEAFPGFSQIKQGFPSAEAVIVNLPGDPALPQNWSFHPTVVSLLGKVNAHEFEGKPPETLRFAHLRHSRNHNVKQLLFVYRPEGWNTMYDPKTKQWQRVVFEETKRPLYEPADFSPLLELKSEPVAAG